MDNRQIRILAVIAVLILMGEIALLNFRSNIIFKDEVIANVIVGEDVALNLDTDKLYFGTVPVTGYSTRGLIVNNTKGYYVYALTDPGNDWLYVNLPNPIKTNFNTTPFQMIAKPDPSLNIPLNTTLEDKIIILVLKRPLTSTELFVIGKKLIPTLEVEPKVSKINLTVLNTNEDDGIEKKTSN